MNAAVNSDLSAVSDPSLKWECYSTIKIPPQTAKEQNFLLQGYVFNNRNHAYNRLRRSPITTA